MKEIVSKNSEGDETTEEVINLPENEFLQQRLRQMLESDRNQLNADKQGDESFKKVYERNQELFYKIIIFEDLLKHGKVTKTEIYKEARRFAIMDKDALSNAFNIIKHYCETGDRNDMV